MKILTALVICLLVVASANAAIVTASHTAVDDFLNIPDSVFENYIDTMVIYELHQSHGSRNIVGMVMLYYDDSTIKPPDTVISDWWDVDVPSCGLSDLGQAGDTCYINILRDTLTNNSNIDAITWSFSHTTWSNDSLDIIAHLTAMHNMAADFPNVAVIMQTAQVASSVYGQSIRDQITQINHWVRDLADTITLSNFYLFDVADIMAFNRNTQAYDSTAPSDTMSWITQYVADSGITPIGCVSSTTAGLSRWRTASNIGDWNCHHASVVTNYVPLECGPDAGNYICQMHGEAMLWLLANISGAYDYVEPQVPRDNVWYVSKAGDNTTGKTWAHAFTDPNTLNDSIDGGDTVYVGAGHWYDVLIEMPANETTCSTTIACSTMTSDTYNDAIFDGSYPVPVTEVSKYIVNGDTNMYAFAWDGDATSRCVSFAAGHDALGNRAYTLQLNDTLFWSHTELPGGGDNSWRTYDMMNDDATDSVYVWLPTGYDSIDVVNAINDTSLTVSCHPVIWSHGDKVAQWRITGIHMRMGKQGVIVFSGSDDENMNFLIDHCKIEKACHEGGENPGAIMSRDKPDSLDNFNEYLTISYCEIWGNRGGTYETTASTDEHAGDGIHLYNCRNVTVDHCWIHDNGGNGITFKQKDAMPTATLAGPNTFKFNYIWNSEYYGIVCYNKSYRDSAYGNVIGHDTVTVSPHNHYSSPHTFGYGGWKDFNGHVEHSGNFAGNNTFFNVALSIHSNDIGATAERQNYFMYNLSEQNEVNGNYDCGGMICVEGDFADSLVADYNLYANSSLFDAHAPSTMTWSAWVLLGFDINGDTLRGGSYVDSVYSGTLAGFARTGASGEFNVTYGGVNWTVAGAIQPGITTTVDPETMWGGSTSSPRYRNFHGRISAAGNIKVH